MEKFFSSENRAFLFVIEEIFLLLLIITQLYLILGIKLANGTVLFFQNPLQLPNLLWLISTILFFITLYFGIAMRDKLVIKVHKEFHKLVFGTAKQKFFGMDREVIALLLSEFIFALLIALAIYIYLDPDVTIPGFNKVVWPYNIIAFVVFVIVGLWIFSQTKPFREAVYGDSIVRKKILPAERLFPTRRITNTRRNTIRISHKKKSFTKRNRTKLKRKK